MYSPRATTEAGLIRTTQGIRNLFSEIDKMVERFLQENSHRPNEHIVGEIPSLGSQQEYSILQLMTHVMTHEFHHKGQIMTMGRMLGYTPPDADVICF
nr:DinB family protein [Paenibacillus cellulositrophicus]